MSGVVTWLTGLPSSGKTLLAVRTVEALRALGTLPILLDGDALRSLMRPAPGYTAAAREDFYETLAGLAAHLASQGHLVLVPATANRTAYRERARALAPRFIEVYVNAPITTCIARDAKGLYAASKEGALSDVPGLGASYEAPVTPDVVATGGRDDEARDELIRLMMEKGRGASR